MTGEPDSPAMMEQPNLLEARPLLHAGVEVYPQLYRNVTWYLLHDESSGQQLLADETSWQLLNQVKQGATLGESLASINANRESTLPDEMATQLVLTLANADMLDGDMRTPVASMLERKAKKASKVFWQKLLTPFSIRIPLLDPNWLLDKLSFVPRVLFNPISVILLLGWMLYALYLTSGHWGGLISHWDSRFSDPTNLLWLLVLYPVVKGIHELGHGLAARHWGAEIHEMGVMLLVFMPVPYVDASSTSAFYNPRHRMVVAAAGILVELLLSATAIIAWVNMDAGLIRDLCFNVAIVGGVSTLLFNGNPLLKFDGYYVFSDLVQIPNLGTRASAYLGYLTKTRLLGLDLAPPVHLPSERPWLVGYAISSGIYRLAIGFTIILYISSQFFQLGLLLGVWYALNQMLRPMATNLYMAGKLAAGQNRLTRSLVVTIGLGILLPVAFFLVPLPHSTVGHGILLPPEHSMLRAQTEGFIETLHVRNGEIVSQGQTLLTLRNEDLRLDREVLQNRHDEQEARFRLALTSNRANAAGLKSELQELAKQLAELDQDLKNLTVRSNTVGRFSLAGPSIDEFRFVERGSILGFVIPRESWSLRVLVDQQSVNPVRTDLQAIQVVSRATPFIQEEAVFGNEIPLATQKLPNRSLGSLAGGPIPVDASDPKGVSLLRPMFQFQVTLPSADYNVGQTFIVRFRHTPEPIGIRWMHQVLVTAREVLAK